MYEHVTTIFEAELQKLSIQPQSEGDASSPWYRFKLDGRDAQSGVDRRAQWVVSIALGKLTTDPGKLEGIQSAIRRANGKLPKGVSPAMLLERDCYLWAQSSADVDWVAGDASLVQLRLDKLLSSARALAQRDEGGKILRSFAAG